MKKQFAFLPSDYKAAQDWLNEYARDGYELVEITPLRVAVFKEAAQPLQYAVVPWPQMNYQAWEGGTDAFVEFMLFLETCGWTRVEYTSQIQIFSAPTDLPPPQSDPVAEGIHLKRRYVLWTIVTTLVTLGLLLFLFFREASSPTWALSLYSTMLLTFALIMIAVTLESIGMLIWSIYMLIRAQLSIKRGWALPHRSIPVAKRRFYLLLSIPCVLVLLSLVCSVVETTMSPTGWIGVFASIYLVGLLLMGNVFLKKKKNKALKRVALLTCLIYIVGSGIVLYRLEYGNAIDPAQATQYPVVSRMFSTIEETRFLRARSPLMVYHMYEEMDVSWEYITTTTYDCVCVSLAKTVFYQLHHRLDRQFPGHSKKYVPIEFPSAEDALNNEAYGSLILRKGKRVILLSYPDSLRDADEYIDKVQQLLS
ncbi:DUF2812 domain-containing protein [Christensenellaceae bacterium OttesenSCG-928-M15]|nr:DUF2812 domain-containing protein [Christensenellaceae bacterium OttesenSCG-928-M15]